jgi:alanine-alpha-ketoisovalerate/valine-pyruvate aminotransferase
MTQIEILEKISRLRASKGSNPKQNAFINKEIAKLEALRPKRKIVAGANNLQCIKCNN